jgi:hypothetical protein
MVMLWYSHAHPIAKRKERMIQMTGRGSKSGKRTALVRIWMIELRLGQLRVVRFFLEKRHLKPVINEKDRITYEQK